EFFAILSNTYKVGQTFLSDTKEVTDKNVRPTENNDEIKITRRHLPHWELKGATYFITFRTVQELSVEEQKLILNHIVNGNEKFYTLIAVIVMPDHVHLLLTPKEDYDLSRIMKGIKGVSARQINLNRADKNVRSTKKETSGSIWQDESFDRIIRDQNELNEKLDYMLNNPVRSGLTESPWDYHGWYFNLTDGEGTDRNVCPTDINVKNITPEEIFYYIYATLYSNTYRTRIDFPRVPFTKDYEVFSEMGEYGKRLVDLHLLKSKDIDTPVVRFQGRGEDKIDKVRYESVGTGHDLPRVYINNDQYFEGIKPEVWGYQIGGYQVCDKWLKDRKGRRLSLDDIMHYCRVVTSLEKTIEVQKEIDDIYIEVEKGIIEL
ncbi:MAG: transposase, partial [Deltaproteobacteria bacterium]|nr:transposase [Deltaproteobacteria bacterium]